MSKIKHLVILIAFLFVGCKNEPTAKKEEPKTYNKPIHYSTQEEEYSPSSTSEEEQATEIDEDNYTTKYNSREISNDEDQSEDDSKYEDGTHTATVNYYNPETGFSNTYTLEVEVEDNEVIKINFPKGGWLDSDHITPEELDESGEVTIYGEEGKTYEIQIED